MEDSLACQYTYRDETFQRSRHINVYAILERYIYISVLLTDKKIQDVLQQRFPFLNKSESLSCRAVQLIVINF